MSDLLEAVKVYESIRQDLVETILPIVEYWFVVNFKERFRIRNGHINIEYITSTGVGATWHYYEYGDLMEYTVDLPADLVYSSDYKEKILKNDPAVILSESRV